VNADADPIGPTLGELLLADARHVATRRQPRIGWLHLLAPVIRRSVSLPVSGAARYARLETLPSRRTAARPRHSSDETLDAPLEGGPLLQPEARERLRPLLGAAADTMRIHQGPGADTRARAHGAEALTIGRDVYFRRGAFSPRDPRGIALLGHEAFHVSSFLQPSAAWRRATTAGLHEEEELAAARERRLLGLAARSALTAPPGASKSVSADRSEGVDAASFPAARPMKAETDRPLGDVPATAAPPERGAEEMRKAAVRDLMNQIRIEFERGA